MSRIHDALSRKQQEISTSGELHGCATQVGAEELGSLRRQPDAGSLSQLLQVSNSVAEQLRFEHTPAPDDAQSYRELNLATSASASSKRKLSPEDLHQLRLRHPERSRLVFHSDPDGLAAEQLRFVRRTLEHKFSNGAILLVSSPAPKDGKTLTTFNLCACLADAGGSTLLVEGDIRRPSFRNLLSGTSTIIGVEEALAGTVEPRKVIHFVPELSIYAAPVAKPPVNPSRLVGGIGTKQFLSWAKEHFHWVVLDSPPVLPAMDVAQLAALASATLLVVRAGTTPRELTTRAIELLGNHLFGVILNEATINSNYDSYLSDYRLSKRAHRYTGFDGNDKQS